MFIIPLRVSDDRSFGTLPLANIALVMFLMVVFFLGWQPTVGPGGPWHGMLTHAFGHANFMHLCGNLIFLIVYGNALNRRIGNLWYLASFLGCGLAVGIVARIFCPGPLIGASGAIFGIIAMTSILLPAASIEFQLIILIPFTLLFAAFREPKQWWEWWIRFTDFRVKALWALFFAPFLELVGLVFTGWNWSNLAHLLGFVAGVVMVALMPNQVVLERRWARA